jgi:hypothetical protein
LKDNAAFAYFGNDTVGTLIVLGIAATRQNAKDETKNYNKLARAKR